MKKRMESSVVFFPCHDQQETRDYYTNVLGLTIHQEKRGKPDPGHRLWLSGLCGIWGRSAHGNRRVHLLQLREPGAGG